MIISSPFSSPAHPMIARHASFCPYIFRGCFYNPLSPISAAQMWDHRLEPRKPISGHILKKQWFSFPSSSVVGTPASTVAGRETLSVRWRMRSDWLHFCRGWGKSLQILSLWATFLIYLSTVKSGGKSPGDNYHNKLQRGLHGNSFAKQQSTCDLYTKSEFLSDKQNSG